MLRIENLNQFYGESHTLWDMGLEVEKGSCTCLMGRNGVGKTTLLKSMMGLLPIQSGEVSFQGRDLAKAKASERARAGIGYVPQGREIFGQMTVEENLRIGLRSRSDGVDEIPQSIFEIFPVLKDMLHRRGGDLSGGQQQQLAIGRALAVNPSLLILDEPTEGIQPNIVAEIGSVIRKLNEEDGITILVVSQKLPFVRKVGHSFTIMDKGRAAASGTLDELTDEMVKEYLSV